MTSKERMIAAIEGKETDKIPVHSSYNFLTNADHWVELTGLPVWKFYEWGISSDKTWRKEIYKLFYDTLLYDVVQPNDYASMRERENVEIIIRDEKPYYHYKKDDTYKPVPEKIHEAGSGGGANEIRYIYTKQDAKERLKLRKADEMISDGGWYESVDELRSLYNDRYLISGGVVNTFYGNAYHVGMMNLYTMLYEEPELIHYISSLFLEQNIETIRAMAKTGGEAIIIDDATATLDMISVRMYEEFSLPYLIPQVKEIQRLGLKAIVIYFGGIEDRVEQIVSTGADVLCMETSMKGYTNDYTSIAKRLDGKICLAGNLDPLKDIEKASDAELETRMSAMAKAGKEYGKYFTCTGSPITPNTSVEHIQKYIEISHRL